jgi:hypothetical protein
LVVSDISGLSSRILLGNGDGTFTPAASVGTAVPVAIVVDDFNDDGNADLAEVTTSFGSDSITIYLGHGDGTFSAQPSTYSAGRGARLTTGDFNSDGKRDLSRSPQAPPEQLYTCEKGTERSHPGPLRTDLMSEMTDLAL